MLRYSGQVRTFDITKARQRLRYEPRVNMEEGLRHAVHWHLLQQESIKETNQLNWSWRWMHVGFAAQHVDCLEQQT